MTRTLHLHIGASKTGTTYLQQTLHGNAEALARAGVLVPATQLDHFRFMADALGQRRFLPRPQAVRRAAAALVEETRAWLGEGEDRSAVITHELFAAATEEQVERLLGLFPGVRVEAHYTVRALGRALPAEWQQAVKGGSDLTMADFTAGVMACFGSDLPEQPAVVGESQIVPKFAALHDVGRVLPRWAAHLGADRVHVVTVPRQPKDRTELWQRFAASLGLDPEPYPVPGNVRANVSLGAAEAEMLRRANAVLRARHGEVGFALQRAVRRLALSELVGRPGALPLVLPEAVHAWATAEGDAVAAHVASAGYALVGEVEDLLASPWQPGRTPDELGDEAVAEAAVHAVAALLGEGARTVAAPASAPAPMSVPESAAEGR